MGARVDDFVYRIIPVFVLMGTGVGSKYYGFMDWYGFGGLVWVWWGMVYYEEGINSVFCTVLALQSIQLFESYCIVFSLTYSCFYIYI